MNRRSGVVGLLVGVLLSCSPNRESGRGSRTPADEAKVTFELLDEQRPPAHEVKWLSHDELPYGFTVSDDVLTAQAEYPTATDAHAVLGIVAIQHPPLLSEEQEEKVDRASNFQKFSMRRELEKPFWEAMVPKVERLAAEKGANALVPTNDRTSYWAIYVSPTRPAAGPSTKSLLASVTPPGHREVARATLPMAEMKPGTFDARVRRGRCYTLAVAMAPDAVRGKGRGWGFHYQATRPQGSAKLRTTTTTASLFSDGIDGIETRAGLGQTTFCPLVSEEVTWSIRASGKSPAGDGDAVVVVLERNGQPNEVRDATCNACQPLNVGCSGQLTHVACKASTECLRALGMTAAQCR